MTKAQEELVEKTVHRTLTTLGFDVTNPTEVQKDIAYLQHLRQTRKTSTGIVRQAVITTAVLMVYESMRKFIGF